MSLLQNEDFAIYRIRSRYLQTVRDGVGDRLISLNPTALNLPGFRNAGWGNPADIKRTHSPPIGTNPDYLASFHHRDRPTPVAEESDQQSQWEAAKNGDEEPDFLPGRVPLNDHIGRPLQRPPTRQDDESSDSDSGDDEETGSNGALQQIQFSKVPLRTRSGSSPIRSIRTGPQVLITSPSKNDGNRLRSGSHGALEFARRAANQERQSRRARAGTDSDSDAFQFDRRTRSSLSSYDNNVVRFEDPGEESDDSTALSSEFTETADSNPSVMKNPFNRLRPPPSATPMISYDLPPARPISMIQPISALTQLLRAKKPGNAMYDFSIFSGKGELRPLDCRIYCPKSSEPVKPMKILLRRDQRTDKGVRETTVAEAIGFALYTYIEEKIEPSLTEEQCDVNRWTFRMVEDDGEVDFDFPPLDRTKPITGYIPKDRRGAQRGPGEFALVQATQEQYEEHQRVTPNVNPTPAPSKPAPIEEVGEEPTPTGLAPAAAKALEIPGSQITPIARTGPTRILRIFMNTVDDFAKTVGLSVTTDTTFGEVLDLVCKKKHLNKAEFVLKIFGTTIIVSGDKTVETLGEDKDLELIRRSYRETPNLGASRTPSSFTTPILHSMTSTAPVAKKKAILQPHGGTPDVVFSLGYQKFVVYRRQPMSFINRHERVLAIDGEYVHVMPSDSKTIFESPKTISLHISSIVGCKTSKKNPHNFRIAVLKSEPRETKLYDFEATNTEQAFEIVNALKEKLETYKMDHPMDQRYYPKGFK